VGTPVAPVCRRRLDVLRRRSLLLLNTPPPPRLVIAAAPSAPVQVGVRHRRHARVIAEYVMGQGDSGGGSGSSGGGDSTGGPRVTVSMEGNISVGKSTLMRQLQANGCVASVGVAVLCSRHGGGMAASWCSCWWGR
jgi:hypothetical protein